MKRTTGWTATDQEQTRNAHSLVWFQFGVEFSLVLSSQQKCTEPSSFDENTFTSFQNMPDTRRDIVIWPHMFHQLSALKKVTELLLDNADHSARLYVQVKDVVDK